MLWSPIYDYLNMALHNVYYLLEAANIYIYEKLLKKIKCIYIQNQIYMESL
jgi:hypothetical protein